MQIFKEAPSLRNYLTPKPGACSLKISLITDNQEILEKSSFPFLEATQSDPLHRLIKGKFITEASTEIGEVFLLVQRDHYLLKNDELWPITNATIEQSWQRALLNHWQKSSCIFLSHPMDGQNEFKGPWEPLFFCKKQKLFFPNLCPSCGKIWQLCREDELLAEFKLPIYSQSLERFLYCPACFKQGNVEFFTYSSSHAHPNYVKDRFALISALGNLFSLAIAEDLFPCKLCSHQGECFGRENLAQTRITPFSFYPFYMIIFKAGSLNAQDFIALLGGAKEKELQAELQLKQEMGRRESVKAFFREKDQQTNYLFLNNDNFFGEILYLKLAFLQAVMEKLWAGDDFSPHPERRLSLDRIWVELPSPAGLLPTFWNFQVEIMDVPYSLPASPFSAPLSVETFYFLGQLWFYTLLVNKKQRISQVYSALSKVREIISKGESFSFVQFSPVFSPQNIFWNPDDQKVPGYFLPFWEEALQLGWSLLMWSLPEKSAFAPPSLLNNLNKLRGEIKNYIFQVKVPETKAALFKEDMAIRGILKKILAEWMKGEQISAEEAIQTVILKPQQLNKEVIQPGEVEEIQETVIISKEISQPSKPLKLPEVEEEVFQTVILRPDSKSAAKSFISSERKENDEVGETMMLTPQTSLADDLSAETVVISPSKPKKEREEASAEKFAQKERSKGSPGGGEGEDVLSETVIIQPKRNMEKGRYGGKK